MGANELHRSPNFSEFLILFKSVSESNQKGDDQFYKFKCGSTEKVNDFHNWFEAIFEASNYSSWRKQWN